MCSHLIVYLITHPGKVGKRKHQNVKWFTSVIAASIAILCFFPSNFNFFSAVLESGAIQSLKGADMHNSFVPIFITKYKFYTNSLSKGTLTHFPFPVHN